METAQSREYFGNHPRGRAGHAKLNEASVRDEGAAGFAERTESLIAGNGAEDLVIIPRLAGLGRHLHLREQHVVHKTAVLAHMAVFDIESFTGSSRIFAITALASSVPAALIDAM